MSKMRHFLFALLMLAFIAAACGPVTPVATPLAKTPLPAPTPQTKNDGNPYFEPLTPENIDRLEQVDRLGTGNIYDVAISPDQSTLAVYVGTQIYIYDAATFDLKQTIPTGKYILHTYERRGAQKILTFTSDSKKIVFSDGKRILFWSLAENKIQESFSSLVPDWAVVDIGLSPDEKRIVLTTLGGSARCDGRDMNFALYDLDGKLIFDRYTCADYAQSFYHFTSDGKVLLIFASIMTGVYPTQTMLVDGVSGNILEATRAQYLEYEVPQPDLKLLYNISPDGNILAYAIYNRIEKQLDIRTELVNAKTRQVIHKQEGLVAFSMDQGKVTWETWDRYHSPLGMYYMLPNTTENELCNLNIRHQMDQYKALATWPEHAIFGVIHRGQTRNIELWDTVNCKVEKTISYPSVENVTFSPDGQWLAGTDGYHAYLWSTQTGKLQFMVEGKAFEAPYDIIQFNADGSRFLASTYGWDNVHPDQPYRNYKVSIFDTKTGQLLRELTPDTEFLKSIVATPEKDLVLLQDSVGQHVWNIETGEKIATLPTGPFVFTPKIGTVWIAPQAKGNSSKFTYKISLYNYHTGEKSKELGSILTTWIRNLYLDSSGSRLLAHLFLGQGKENGDAVAIFDTKTTGKELSFYKLPWLDYEMSAYGDFFATNDSKGTVNLWDYQANSPIRVLRGNHPNWKISDQYKDAKDKDDISAMLANTNWIDTLFLDQNILITRGNHLRFWDINNGSMLTEVKPDYDIELLRVSPDHTLIAVVGKDGIIRLWGVPRRP